MNDDSDDSDDLEPIDPAPPPAFPAGWYADPWTAGQYRYWTGDSWTGETNRWGPATAPPAAAPGTEGLGAEGAATRRVVTDPWSTAPLSTSPARPSPPAGEIRPEPGGLPPRRGPVVAGTIALIVVVLASGGIGYAINSRSHSNDSSVALPGPATSQPAPSSPTTPGPSTPAPTIAGGRPVAPDPDRHALAGLVVQQADVGTGRTVLLIGKGNLLTQPTLDLCNGTYPSEGLRRSRLQVADFDPSGAVSLSTEAVLYRDAAASEQAFAELRKVSAACPHGPVASPVGESTKETEFNPAPDAAWPHTPSVERLAYSMVTTEAGTASPSVAVVPAPRPRVAGPVLHRAGRRATGGRRPAIDQGHRRRVRSASGEADRCRRVPPRASRRPARIRGRARASRASSTFAIGVSGGSILKSRSRIGAVPTTSIVGPFQRASSVIMMGRVTPWSRSVPVAVVWTLLPSRAVCGQRDRRGQREARGRDTSCSRARCRGRRSRVLPGRCRASRRRRSRPRSSPGCRRS